MKVKSKKYVIIIWQYIKAFSSLAQISKESLISVSDKNWADAVKNCYDEAKKSLRGIRNIQVIESDVKVKEDVDKLIYKFCLIDEII